MEKLQIVATNEVSVYKLDGDLVVDTKMYTFGFEEEHIKFFKYDKNAKMLTIVDDSGANHTFNIASGDLVTETPAGEITDDHFETPEMPSKDDVLAKLKLAFPDLSLESVKACLMAK